MYRVKKIPAEAAEGSSETLLLYQIDGRRDAQKNAISVTKNPFESLGHESCILHKDKDKLPITRSVLCSIQISNMRGR